MSSSPLQMLLLSSTSRGAENGTGDRGRYLTETWSSTWLAKLVILILVSKKHGVLGLIIYH